MTTPLLDRAALRELLDRATPGPWSMRYGSVAATGEALFRRKPDGGTQDDRWSILNRVYGGTENLEFCVAARNALPSLLDALDTADREKEEAESRAETAERERDEAREKISMTADWKSLAEKVMAERDAALASAAAAEERGRAAIEALERVEWCVRDVDDGPSCPICAHAMFAGHRKTCPVRAALALPTAPRPPEDAAPRLLEEAIDSRDPGKESK